MTWDEFKAKVDAEILAQGKDGAIELESIDFSVGYELDGPLIIEAGEEFLRVFQDVNY